jgi:hypothetical protein
MSQEAASASAVSASDIAPLLVSMYFPLAKPITVNVEALPSADGGAESFESAPVASPEFTITQAPVSMEGVRSAVSVVRNAVMQGRLKLH